LADATSGGIQECCQLPELEKRMACDEAEQFVDLFRALRPGRIGNSISACKDASVQPLFASLPCSLIQEQLPRRNTRRQIRTDSNPHN
jgi:hypothetical protein